MMNFLVYILAYPLILLISILPFRILYLLSDLLFFIIFHLVGYRKKVVMRNLKIAFPEKSTEELKQIQKKFYHHFVDLFLEMVKTFSISKKELLKRLQLTNQKEFKEFFDKYDSVIVMSSHYAGYEWSIILNQHMPMPFFIIYKEIKNHYFDNFVKKTRTKFDSVLVTPKEVIPLMKKNFRNKIRGAYGFLSDQSPKRNKIYHWSDFFGVKVPVLIGAEIMAKKYNFPVVYMEASKVKRGYYQTTMKVLCEDPSKVPNYEITDLFMKTLEEQIRREPAYYFWTHKRFKHMGLYKPQK